MRNTFTTISGEIIDISMADRVHCVRLTNIDNMSKYEFGVVVKIENKEYILATTGKNKGAAEFHADAIAIDLGLKSGGESIKNRSLRS